MAGLNESQIENFIRNWLLAVVNIPVVEHQQSVRNNTATAPAVGGNVPRPARTYMTYHIATAFKIGRSAELPPVETEPDVFDLPTIQQWEFVVTVTAYGENALFNATAVIDAVDADNSREQLLQNCVVPVETLGDVIRTKELLNNTEWETRCTFDLKFRTTTDGSSGDGIIEKVKLNGKHHDGRDGVPIEYDKTISA